MRKIPESMWSNLNRIDVRNNWVHPPKELLNALGITLQEFIFFKWKKYRELEYAQKNANNVNNNNNNNNNNISGEWRGTYRMKWSNKSNQDPK
jgi:hypothetical protein